MAKLTEPRQCNLRYSLFRMIGLVAVANVVWAFVPLAALITIGAMPVSAGFVVFVIGDQRDNDGLVAIGLTMMTFGLFAGALLMSVVQGAAP